MKEYITANIEVVNIDEDIVLMSEIPATDSTAGQ